MSATERQVTEKVQHGCQEISTDDEGWVYILCDCGSALGVFPDNETAVDGLIDHIYSRIFEASR